MDFTQKLALGGVTLVLASGTLLGNLNLLEGRRYPVYYDIGGVATVCEGHTGPEVRIGDTWTKERCDSVLINNATSYGLGVLNCVTVPINQNQFEALTLFAINVGTNGMCKSRATRLLNKGQYTEACHAMSTGPDGKPAWSYVKGKYVQGLQNRRIFERNLCLTPMPKVMPQFTAPQPLPLFPQVMQAPLSLL